MSLIQESIGHLNLGAGYKGSILLTLVIYLPTLIHTQQKCFCVSFYMIGHWFFLPKEDLESKR